MCLKADCGDDIIATDFGSDPQGIFFGVTASTGASSNLHKLCPQRLINDVNFDRDTASNAMDIDSDVANEGQIDLDGDGTGDACDDDRYGLRGGGGSATGPLGAIRRAGSPRPCLAPRLAPP